jgi:hypothetical protein
MQGFGQNANLHAFGIQRLACFAELALCFGFELAQAARVVAATQQ